MTRSSAAMILCLAASLAGTSRADETLAGRGVSLEIAIKQNEMFVYVVNRSAYSTRISYPFPVTVVKSMGGLEFTFHRRDAGSSGTSNGELCAFIDGPLERFPVPVTLHGGTAMGAQFRLDDLQQLHCLENGAYEMRVKYHNPAASDTAPERELEAVAEILLTGKGKRPPNSAGRYIPKSK